MVMRHIKENLMFLRESLRENLMCLITRSETRATKSMFDSSRHATELSDYIYALNAFLTMHILSINTFNMSLA